MARNTFLHHEKLLSSVEIIVSSTQLMFIEYPIFLSGFVFIHLFTDCRNFL